MSLSTTCKEWFYCKVVMRVVAALCFIGYWLCHKYEPEPHDETVLAEMKKVMIEGF